MELPEFKHFQRYRTFVSNLRRLIGKEKNVDSLLEVAQFYGNLQWQNYSGSYSDISLEKKIESSIENLLRRELNLAKAEMRDGVSVIASQLYDTGGHTPIVLSWIRLLSTSIDHRLIVTRKITEKILEEVKRLNAKLFLCEKKGLELIREIILFARGTRTLVLHIHPDDIFAAISARLLRRIGYTVIFFAHADHVFSFGNDADVFCEISAFGMEISKRSGRVRGEQVFLGIPLNPRKSKIPQVENLFPSIQNQPSDKINIVSCGSPYKYRPSMGMDFSDFINSLLCQPLKFSFLLVGPDGNESWWQTQKPIWGQRVKFLGKVPFDAYGKILEDCDVYVDSFPLGGGTAFPEPLLMGKPCTGLSGPIQGATFADELRVNSISELVEKVVRLAKKNPKEISIVKKVKRKVEIFQSELAFKERVEKIYEKSFGYFAEVPIPPVSPNMDSFWFEKMWSTEGNILIDFCVFRGLRFWNRIQIFFAGIKSLNLPECVRIFRNIFLNRKHTAPKIRLGPKKYNRLC